MARAPFTIPAASQVAAQSRPGPGPPLPGFAHKGEAEQPNGRRQHKADHQVEAVSPPVGQRAACNGPPSGETYALAQRELAQVMAAYPPRHGAAAYPSMIRASRLPEEKAREEAVEHEAGEQGPIRSRTGAGPACPLYSQRAGDEKGLLPSQEVGADAGGHLAEDHGGGVDSQYQGQGAQVAALPSSSRLRMGISTPPGKLCRNKMRRWAGFTAVPPADRPR